MFGQRAAGAKPVQSKFGSQSKEVAKPAEDKGKQLVDPSDAATAERDSDANQAKEQSIQAHAKRREEILAEVVERIDAGAAVQMSREELEGELATMVNEILIEKRIVLSQRETQDVTKRLVDEMIGFGPLEPLLEDESVTDIMVNGPFQVYVERRGKLVLSDVRFRNNAHVMNLSLIHI